MGLASEVRGEFSMVCEAWILRCFIVCFQNTPGYVHSHEICLSCLTSRLHLKGLQTEKLRHLEMTSTIQLYDAVRSNV